MKPVRSSIAALGILLAACGAGASPSQSAAAPKPSVDASASAPASAAPKPASPSQQLDKMTVAYTTVSTEQLAPAVAKEEGIFAANGLDVDVVPIGTGSSPASAVISGQVQAYLGATEVLLADLGGADLVFVAAPSTVSQFWLFTLPDIKTADDLKGKKIAVTALGSATHTAVKQALRSLKLDPDKDVTILALNNPPAIMAAMQNGAVQAASIGSGNYVLAKQAGWNQMVDVAKLGVPFLQGWPVMSKKYIDGHQDVTQRFVKSLVQGIAFELQKPAETQQVLSKYSKNTDESYLKGNWELVTPYLRKVPSPEAEGIRNALAEIADANPQAKTADPASFIDGRWVKSLEDSGFIVGLYK